MWRFPNNVSTLLVSVQTPGPVTRPPVLSFQNWQINCNATPASLSWQNDLVGKLLFIIHSGKQTLRLLFLFWQFMDTLDVGLKSAKTQCSNLITYCQYNVTYFPKLVFDIIRNNGQVDEQEPSSPVSSQLFSHCSIVPWVYFLLIIDNINTTNHVMSFIAKKACVFSIFILTKNYTTQDFFYSILFMLKFICIWHICLVYQLHHTFNRN